MFNLGFESQLSGQSIMREAEVLTKLIVDPIKVINGETRYSI